MIRQFLDIWGEHWSNGNSCRVLKQLFHHPFLLTCICSRNWFSISVHFFLGPPSLLSSFSLLDEVEQAVGCFRLQRCSKCTVSPTETRGTAQLLTHLQEAKQAGPLGWSCYIPPLNTVYLYVNLPLYLTICLSASTPWMWRSVLSHFYYLLSHTPCLPPPYPTVCPFPTHCLFIHCAAAASAPVDEIVMVTVISCGDDKKGESHRVEVAFDTYGA